MKPLEGIRILTVEQFGAGPYGSLFLSDLGAEVIKIENAATKGDTGRQVGPHFLGDNDSALFPNLRLQQEKHHARFQKRGGSGRVSPARCESDAVMNNLRGDQPSKLGLDYKALPRASIRSDRVPAHLGLRSRQRAPGWPGYDFLMQAETGLMSSRASPTDRRNALAPP